MGIDKKTGYWTEREILGYGAKYNMVLSDRGRGKSYRLKKFLVDREGECFMCLYRQAPDLRMAMSDWLDDLVAQGYSYDQFEWEGSDAEGWQLNIDGVRRGWFRYLTQVNHIKQESFPDNLCWVWLDEFIPLAYKKLPGVESEGDAIRTIVKTIEHDSVHDRESKGLKPVRVIMCANPFTWNNPILSYFKVTPREGVHRIGPGIVCEYLPPIDSGHDGKQTADDFLGDEVHKSQGWREQMAFVAAKWPKGMDPMMSLRIRSDYFVVLKGPNRTMYVQKVKHHANIRNVYGSFEGLKESELCLDKDIHLDLLKRYSYRGQLWFKDINTKFDFLNDLESL